jgi:hypothetical protein
MPYLGQMPILTRWSAVLYKYLGWGHAHHNRSRNHLRLALRDQTGSIVRVAIDDVGQRLNVAAIFKVAMPSYALEISSRSRNSATQHADPSATATRKATSV